MEIFLMTSTAQITANRKNAQKSTGPLTTNGKAIVSQNALKHGLLAKEVVVTMGEGAESPDEFDALLDDLLEQLGAVGPVEEMLVEKIAIAYWRLRRAYRYEVGLIRRELDNATDDFYDTKQTDQELDQKIQDEEREMAAWKVEKTKLVKPQKAGKSLKVTFEQEDVWDWLQDSVKHILPSRNDDDRFLTCEEIRAFLSEKCEWDDDYIWEKLIEICDKKISENQDEISRLKKQKQRNKLKLEVVKKLGTIPSKDELDRLLRYEGAIERQLYKAMNQLERLQRLRLGDHVPAPVEVDVAVNSDQNQSASGFVS
jgi:hypothetical protein